MSDQSTYTATNLPVDGTTIEASDVNTDLQGLIDEFNKNVGTNKITDGAVTLAKIAAEPWTTYTPVITQGVVVTQNTTYSKYTKSGKTVIWSWRIGLTSSGTAGMAIYMTVPVPMATPLAGVIGIGGYQQAGTADYQLKIFINDANTIGFADTSQHGFGVLFGNSVTVANGDSINGTITYEGA